MIGCAFKTAHTEAVLAKEDIIIEITRRALAFLLYFV
jgi:hypothetical protein